VELVGLTRAPEVNPLMCAAEHGHEGSAFAAGRRGSGWRIGKTRTAPLRWLGHASAHRHTGAVRVLLEAGSSVDARTFVWHDCAV